MRLQKIIDMFKQIEKFAGKDENQLDFIIFLTEKIPLLWDDFLSEKNRQVDNTDMSDAD